jgi:hypothetical protein
MRNIKVKELADPNYASKPVGKRLVIRGNESRGCLYCGDDDCDGCPVV